MNLQQMHQDNGCHSLSDYSDDFCIEEHNGIRGMWMKNSENFKSLYRNTKFRTAQSATEIRERVCLPMSKSKSFSAIIYCADDSQMTHFIFLSKPDNVIS